MVIAVQKWPDKYVWERFLNGVEWADRLDGEAIAAVDAIVVYGDVTIDEPQATDFAGTVQSVHVSGGSRGPVCVSCRVTTTSGLQLEELQWFNIA